MDYKSIYWKLIGKAALKNGRPSRVKDTQEGFENHHVRPVSKGGSNEVCNLVRLTYRQHALAHKILSRLNIATNPILMRSSRAYAAYRERVVQVLKNAAKLRPAPIQRVIQGEDNRRRSETLKAKHYTCPHCNKTGGGGMLTHHFDFCPKNPNRKKPEIQTCEHCGKQGIAPGFGRWHGDNCKKKGA
ncbi:hypothetical protein FA821_13290 [Salmonella enterica]|nr:hypothetical protein [Salmonella enterica]